MSINETKRLNNRRSALPIMGEVVYITGLPNGDAFDPAKIKKRGGVVKMLEYKADVHHRAHDRAVVYMKCLGEFADGYKTVGMWTTELVTECSEHIKQVFEALDAVFDTAPTPDIPVEPVTEGCTSTAVELADVMAWLSNPASLDKLTSEQLLELSAAMQRTVSTIADVSRQRRDVKEGPVDVAILRPSRPECGINMFDMFINKPFQL